MTLCTQCKAQIPTIKTRLNHVNDSLHRIGMSLYQFQSDGMALVYDALKANGFTEWADSQFVDNRLHQSVGEGKYLTVVTHRYETGRYEIVAYVN